MSEARRRTVSLPPEQSAYVDKLIESGSYNSASEVVQAGVQALQDRDMAIDDWLRNEVAPVHDAMVADPSRGIPAEQVFAKVRATLRANSNKRAV